MDLACETVEALLEGFSVALAGGWREGPVFTLERNRERMLEKAFLGGSLIDLNARRKLIVALW